jgi:hypothetical protein
MIRHASVEELAKYDEDVLRPRKHARIRAHLTVCVKCTTNHQRLHAVASILADVSYPPMPEHLSAKINVAIASESAARVASEPSTEAGRLDLPERQRAPRTGFRLPQMSSPLGLRLAAAAGAVVIVAGGGYAIATGLSSVGPSSTAGPTALSSSDIVHAGLKPANKLQINNHGRIEQIRAVRSNVNFEPQTFKTQALAAMKADKSHPGPSGGAGARASIPASGAAASPATPENSAAGSLALPPPNVLQLQACVGHIAAGGRLILVESAHFEHRAATIIVVRPAGTTALDAYAVGSSCSGSDKDILFSVKLPNS